MHPKRSAHPEGELPPTLSPQAGILKAGAAGVELPLKAKHALAQVMMGAAAAQRFTFLDSLEKGTSESGPGPVLALCDLTGWAMSTPLVTWLTLPQPGPAEAKAEDGGNEMVTREFSGS